jgi:hypothetical protein
VRRVFACLALVGCALVSCGGTTGDQLISFTAFASGAPGAAQPFTAGGYSITLTSAKMHVGAVFFDEAPLATGAEGPICIATGVITAQVPASVDVDLLSAAPQEFAVYGNGSADTALSWQMWLTDGDINEANTDRMASLQGIATRISDGTPFSFGAIVSINNNRLAPESDPSQPGAMPICKERIVQIGGIDIHFFNGGVLNVTIDPRVWFNEDLDFSALPTVNSTNCLEGDPLVAISPASYANPPEQPATTTCGDSAQPCCTDASGTPLANGACANALVCTSGTCGPAYCIPNTNFASGVGASQGANLFNGILTGGPAAYAVTYSHE